VVSADRSPSGPAGFTNDRRGDALLVAASCVVSLSKLLFFFAFAKILSRAGDDDDANNAIIVSILDLINIYPDT
jgi:hypothetical protein